MNKPRVRSLHGPGNVDLRAAITPMDSPSMRAAFGRGQAIRSLFEEAGWPGDTAIVLDLPGAESVAAAAALADRFDPVFTFANWLDGEGVDVKMLALDDFAESSEAPPADLDFWFFASAPGGYWYYGGDVSAHLDFWSHYGWHRLARPVTVGPPLVMRARVPQSYRYAPRPRATLFTDPAGPRNFSRFGGTPRANGEQFGRIAVRTARSDGSITGVRPGRSGSFGRFHGSFAAAGG